MLGRRVVWALFAASVGCAEPGVEGHPAQAPAPGQALPLDVPERDPAARGPAAPYFAELPDDRDGDGIPDQLDLCPDLPADRADGCPHFTAR